jgi:hypothetical protein
MGYLRIARIDPLIHDKPERTTQMTLDNPAIRRSKSRLGTVNRVGAGLQCPECYGVRITCRHVQPHDPRAYQCEECGCNWTPAS